MSRGAAVVEVVTIPADQLEAMLARVVAKALSDRGVAGAGDDVSAARVARIVHVRSADVLAALEDGSLKGKRRGNRWMVSVAAAQAWKRGRK